MKRNENEIIIIERIINKNFGYIGIIIFILFIYLLISKLIIDFSCFQIFSCLLIICAFIYLCFRKVDNIFVNEKENYLRINDEIINFDEIETIDKLSVLQKKINVLILIYVPKYGIKTKDAKIIKLNLPIITANKVVKQLKNYNLPISPNITIPNYYYSLSNKRLIFRGIYTFYSLCILFLIYFVFTNMNNNEDINNMILFLILMLYIDFPLFCDLLTPFNDIKYNIFERKIYANNKTFSFDEITHYSVSEFKFLATKFVFYTKSNETIEFYIPSYFRFTSIVYQHNYDIQSFFDLLEISEKQKEI